MRYPAFWNSASVVPSTVDRNGFCPSMASSTTIMTLGLPSASMTAGPRTPSRAATDTVHVAWSLRMSSEPTSSFVTLRSFTIPFACEKTRSLTISNSFISDTLST